jgi:hypothetical protein
MPVTQSDTSIMKIWLDLYYAYVSDIMLQYLSQSCRGDGSLRA